MPPWPFLFIIIPWKESTNEFCALKSYVVQEIESGKTHFARNTIFNENEIPDLSSSSEDSSEDDFIIDVLENISKNNESSGQGNQNLPDDDCLRKYAQENELSEEDEFLTHDQATNEVSTDNTEEADVKTIFERYDENMQSTSIRQEIPRRIFNLGFPYMAMPPPEWIGTRWSGKKTTVETLFA